MAPVSDAPAPPIPGGHRKRQHLGHRPRVNPKTQRRFPPAHACNLNRKANPSVRLHALHLLAPCRFPTKAICCRIFNPALPVRPAASVSDFCSGAYTKMATGGVDGLNALQLSETTH